MQDADTSHPAPAMYVCLCHAVTERQIRELAQAGCGSMTELTMRTGCGAGCGSCRDQAEALLRETCGECPAITASAAGLADAA
jgi:bacterioferritin-associated ferredoxin